ncbi:MAG: hypothetical protein NW202_03095 [Nitrospira sp.]|nr:hypothetical protein [Nitrospira sp.]
MNSTNAVRFLILVIPVVWLVIRLTPAEHSRPNHLQVMAQESYNLPSHREPDKFASNESLFKAHYQSHYATSGFEYHHYRLAYKYGFDLALDPDNQKMGWASVEPQARHNWNEGVMGQWSQHQQAILYGWEQGLKIIGG